MSDRIYYRLEKGGKTETAIKSFVDDYRATIKSWEDFAEKYGADQYYAGDYLRGVMLKNPDPKLWVSTQKLPNGCFKPKRKKGNDIFTEFKTLPGTPDGMELARRIDVECPFEENKIHLPNFDMIDDELYLNMYKTVEPPADCTPMKMSEYYKIKEDAEPG